MLTGLYSLPMVPMMTHINPGHTPLSIISLRKGKGKVHPITGHEGPEGE